MNGSDLEGIVKKQLCADFNCAESDFDYGKLTVTEMPQSGKESKAPDRIMEAAFFGGGAVFCAKPKLAKDLKRIFEGKEPDWIFETNSLIMLSEILYLHGHTIDDMRQYYVPDLSAEKTEPKFETRLLENGFEAFENEQAVKEALEYKKEFAPKLGAVAKENGKIICAAFAFETGPSLWQMTLGVTPQAKYKGAAESTLAFLKNAVLEREKVPYYGGFSAKNISAGTGAAAGFLPFWTQLFSKARSDEFLGLHGTR